PEHLDYHRTMEAYRDAKKRLFDDLSPDACAVFNNDDLYGASVVADSPARRLSYGRTRDAAIRVEVEANTLAGLHLKLDGQRGRFRLVGLFNAYNLAAAYGAAVALGHDGPQVFEALREAPPVPGRFEQIRVSRGRTVVVDYAHTPDALQNVLQTAAALRPPGAALWCVFGCGGDRDRTKRPAMGAIAERLADRLIVTSDNPRSEDPESILAEIRNGMTRPERAQWIVDRSAAIEAAAAASEAGDVVVIAGKGHETYQIVGEVRTTFDDREEARRAFA
ncbi:MAG TPA: UDP-N-acetylmuramyl-tripeptide synthetase, partial [Rhodothermales bacterium]